MLFGKSSTMATAPIRQSKIIYNLGRSRIHFVEISIMLPDYVIEIRVHWLIQDMQQLLKKKVILL